MLVVRPFPDLYSWSYMLDRVVCNVLPKVAEEMGEKVRIIPAGEIRGHRDWRIGATRMMSVVLPELARSEDEHVLWLDPMSGVFERCATLYPQKKYATWLHCPLIAETDAEMSIFLAWCQSSESVFCGSTEADENVKEIWPWVKKNKIAYPIDWKSRGRRWEERGIDVLIVGRDSPVKRIDMAKEIATKAGAKKVIWLSGQLPHDEMQKMYGNAKVLISSSEREGFGLAIAEAAFCGCMPICYPAGVAKDEFGPEALFESVEEGTERVAHELESGEGSKSGNYVSWAKDICNPRTICEALIKGATA